MTDKTFTIYWRIAGSLTPICVWLGWRDAFNPVTRIPRGGLLIDDLSWFLSDTLVYLVFWLIIAVVGCFLFEKILTSRPQPKVRKGGGFE